jgi:hypothetical protein
LYDAAFILPEIASMTSPAWAGNRRLSGIRDALGPDGLRLPDYR